MQFAWYALSLTGRGSFFGPPALAYVLDLHPGPAQALLRLYLASPLLTRSEHLVANGGLDREASGRE